MQRGVYMVCVVLLLHPQVKKKRSMITSMQSGDHMERVSSVRILYIKYIAIQKGIMISECKEGLHGPCCPPIASSSHLK